MLKSTILSLVATAAFLVTSPAVYADEEAERLFNEAMPQMYHTCNSLMELADGDEAVATDVLGKIATISIYMRQINIESFSFSDAQQEEAENLFYLTISEGCAEDPDALLAGIVDDAVKAAFGI